MDLSNLSMLALWTCISGLSLTYPDTRFWDDYLFYDHTVGVTFPRNISPIPLRQELEGLLFGISPATLRIGTFLVLPLTAFLFGRILRSLPEFFDEHECSWIATTFLLMFIVCFPAAFVWVHFNYVLAVLIFVLGWRALISNSAVSRRCVSPALFLLSFRLPSLITFMSVPLIHSLWLVRSQRKRVIEHSIIASILIVLAMLYYPILNQLGFRFQTDYNQVTPSRIARALLVLLASIVPMINCWRRNVRFMRVQLVPDSKVALLTACGSVLLGLALFPYLLTGHLTDLNSILAPLIPGEGSLTSRNLILIPFGASLLVFALTLMLKTQHVLPVRRLLVTVLFILGLSGSIEFKIDALKQESIVAGLRAIPKNSHTALVYFEDTTARFNARGRAIRSYEKVGWLKLSGWQSNRVQVLDDVTTSCSDAKEALQISIASPKPSRIMALLNNELPIKLTTRTVLLCPPA